MGRNGRRPVRRMLPWLVPIVAAGLLAGCAAGANPQLVAAPVGAGFWTGLWHGLILPVTFVVSLFTDSVGVYEVGNSGGWYDFGFVLGVSVAFSGSASSGRMVRRR
ncbi:hypothetical protein [Pseudonocardia hydrocarbonoxydans]|uniref:Uncharacterized protein n=1 Tax=Pseudonocardia hydrocarbonoxydans TaxID=76726 RepID=A0A4Y3WME0_9PSEU|nr:hypothetical protein [Pseudonocardia hydrocarbonoxydans]GEC20092.1 hypothetical protein PHY01_23750 [Pseudonocardia hydrocarbonoxydans]